MNQPRIPKELGLTRSMTEQTQTFKEPIANASSSFSSLMQNTASKEVQSPKMISPFDLAGAKPNMPQTPQALLAQLQLLQNTMTNIQGQMAYPNLKMKPAQRTVIKNKLSSANTSLQAINSKMGSGKDQEEDAAGAPSKGASSKIDKDAGRPQGPISQFLGYVTDGIQQLENAKKQVQALSQNSDSMNPGDFLFIQLKVAKAQQELEFTSSLMAKVVEDFKMIMNIQL
jgi:hypothetical protein